MATSAILFTVSGKGQGNVAIDNNGSALNPIAHTTGTTIGVGANGNTTLTATTNNNFVTSSHTGTGASGASGISGGAGITFGPTDTPNMTWTISGNTINDVDGNGILAVARGVTGILKLKITDNIVEAPMGGVRPGIRVDAGNAFDRRRGLPQHFRQHERWQRRQRRHRHPEAREHGNDQ